MLWLDPEFGERVRTIAPGYMAFDDASRGLESTLRAGGRALRQPAVARGVAFSLAALRGAASPPTSTRSMERAADLAERFAAALADAGYTVAARGRSTLVSFEYPDPPATRERLAEAGIAVRDLPGHPYIRALGRRLERRVRPRAAARGAVKSVCVYCGSSFGTRPRVSRSDAGAGADARRAAACASSTAARRSA